jgi:16S rRNA (uracil1498-N3)-methyltransferase
MRIHRFYIGNEIELKHDFWLHDERLLHQWRNVLRFQPEQEVVLFDGLTHDRLYKIVELTEREAHLQHVTDFERKVPAKNVYLLWSLLKKDKNDWVLQKCTELGISHFFPLLADRSEKTGFNVERAEKIVIEASEQCGRSDIPTIREPMTIQTAIEELTQKVELYICEQEGPDTIEPTDKAVGVFIGPEGGWSDAEKSLFQEKGIKHLNLHDFTLRAETAAVAAVAKMVQ